MGFYAPAQLIQDAGRHGVEVRPADVNASEFDCTLEDGGALRLGFRLISGLRRHAAERIVAARSDGPFRSLAEFVRRTGLTRSTVKTLAEADAFASLDLNRRASLWQSLAVPAERVGGSLFAGTDEPESDESLPELSPFEQVIADYRTTGLSLKGHPIGFYRQQLDARGAVTCAKLASLAHGDRVSVAGLALLRQRPATAKGITFCTLEDETGVANLVLHPRTWERFYRIARCSPAWLAHGVLENKQKVIHLVVRSLEDMTAAIHGVRVPAREFR
jgi:error-prone DNA polymerase